MMTRKRQLALIQNTFATLDDFFELTEHRTKWQGEYQNLILNSEKGHRSGVRGRNNLPLSLACQYFAVKWVFESLNGTHYFDILNCRAESVLGNALAQAFRERLLELFTKEEIKDFLNSVDYAGLN